VFILIPLFFLFSLIFYQGEKQKRRTFSGGTFPEPEPYANSPINVDEFGTKEEGAEKQIFCWNCGVQNDKGMTFCINCGKELAKPDNK
jgi:hypothetical protein